jgi:putative transposase
MEFLSDNGGAYRAHETHALAREMGIEPIHTPVCSPQSNGIAESFVDTFKRDYVSPNGPWQRRSRSRSTVGRFYAFH